MIKVARDKMYISVGGDTYVLENTALSKRGVRCNRPIEADELVAYITSKAYYAIYRRLP